MRTPTGLKLIHRLKRDDKVIACDLEGKCTDSQINKVFVSYARNFATIELVTGVKIEATENHPFYVSDKKDYVPARRSSPLKRLH